MLHTQDARNRLSSGAIPRSESSAPVTPVTPAICRETGSGIGNPCCLSDHASSISLASLVPWGDDQERQEECAPRKKTIRITTFGPFTVHWKTPHGSQAAIWRDERTRTLFKCLLAAPTYWLTRDQLIDMLWPELNLAHGQDALRHALSRLRRALEPERAAYDHSLYVSSDREAVWLARRSAHDDTHNPPLSIWIDRDHFERLAHAALQRLEHDSQRQLGQQLGTQALLLYRDHFLPADLYVEWATSTRNRCRKLWTTLLWHLANAAMTSRQFDYAQILLGQLVEAMPDNEGAVSQLMRVQAACGQRGDALRAYHSLSRHLASEFGAEPVTELKHLADAIRSGTVSTEALLAAITAERQEPWDQRNYLSTGSLICASPMNIRLEP